MHFACSFDAYVQCDSIHFGFHTNTHTSLCGKFIYVLCDPCAENNRYTLSNDLNAFCAQCLVSLKGICFGSTPCCICLGVSHNRQCGCVCGEECGATADDSIALMGRVATDEIIVPNLVDLEFGSPEFNGRQTNKTTIRANLGNQLRFRIKSIC